MATLVEKRCFAMTDQSEGNNNNKFWNVEIYDDGATTVIYGRQGDSGQRQTKNWGSVHAAKRFADQKAGEKTRKGYRPVEVIDSSSVSNITAKSVTTSNLESLAKKQIRSNNPVVANLISYLTKVNAHNISAATGGKITFNDTTGLFSTTMGVVGQGNIDQANDILVKIGDLVAGRDYGTKLIEFTNDYLMLIPQDIGRRRLDHSSFWSGLDKVQNQKQILDSLQASLVTATTSPSNKKAIDIPEEKVFDCQLDLIEDGNVIDRITNMYRSTKKAMHTCSNLDVKTVYAVDINTVRSAFEKDGAKMDNIWELWHGSSSSNLLSILKGGLIIPPASSSHCTGRMFGNGVYASNISTKALGYAAGYWNGKRDSNCFMFVLDMAMGNYHVPSGPSQNLPVRNSDSTFAKPGKSGILNEEMIVYRTSQINLKYLVEFTPNGK